MHRYKISNLKTFNDLRYQKYDSQLKVRFFTLGWDKAVINVLSDIYSDLKDISILDVGCATGRLLKSLAFAGIRNLSGTDIAPKILNVVAKKISHSDINLELKVADAEQNLPWKDEVFDVVTMTGVLHHFYYPTLVLAEIYRVLKKEGVFIIIEPWFPWPLRIPINLYLKVFPREGDCHYYNVPDVKILLNESNFSYNHYKRPSIHSFLLIANRKNIT